METRQSLLKEYAGNSPEIDAKSAGIHRLLASGVRPSQVARALKLPKSTVYDFALNEVKQGFLVRKEKWPALYAEPLALVSGKLTKRCRGSVVGVVKEKGLWQIHRLGLSFFLRRRPARWVGFTSVREQPLRNGGKLRVFRWFEGEFTLEAYSNRVKVWGVGLPVTSGDAVRSEGVAAIAERVRAFEVEQGCSLAFNRILAKPELLIANKALSDSVEKAFKLEVAPIKVGGAELCVDRSHPNNVEIRGEEAEEVVKRFDELLRLAPEIAAAAQGYQTINQALVRQANLITQNTAILQGLYELLEKRGGV